MSMSMTMNIISELPFLKTLLKVDTNNHIEVTEMVCNATLLTNQPGYGFYIGCGSGRELHLVHYIKCRNYFVYMHDITGTCEECPTGNKSSLDLLNRATILHTLEDVLTAVKEEINRVITYGESDPGERDEHLYWISEYFKPSQLP